MVKLGSAFTDSVIGSSISHSKRLDASPWWAGAGRALLFATVLFGAFAVLIVRLADLTIVHGLSYRKLSDGNRTRELIQHAPRGVILDRTGKPLVVNVPQYRLLKPCSENNATECVTRLSKEEGDALQKNGLPPGEYLEVDYVRQYPYEKALAHVIGYTGELSEEELKSEYYKGKNYRLGDRVGRMGVEEVYNERLRGRDGREFVEVDASGRIIRSLGREEPLPGENITLSIDLSLSLAAEAAFPKGEKGAIVVTKPQTGEVLTLFSSPGFSPNAFISGMSTSQYQALVNNSDLPMFNRAIGGVYPPGSTYKIVMAIAGIETGVITRSTIVEDNGSITIGPFTFPNWYFLQYGKTEGPVDLAKALQRSNDIYFYKIGEALGISRMVEWSKKLGLGKPYGIELSGEASGLVPDPDWKAQHFDSEADREARNNLWYLGDTYHMSIGQGYLLTTPLAVNMWTSVISSDGKLCSPTIEKQRVSWGAKDRCRLLHLSSDTVSYITEGMEKACAAGGTGWPLFDFKVQKSTAREGDGASEQSIIHVPIGCKTGTAEYGDPKGKTHAWFTAFAPLDDRYVPDDVKKTESYVSGPAELTVTVLVEGAGEGSTVAAPVAKALFTEWFMR